MDNTFYRIEYKDTGYGMYRDVEIGFNIEHDSVLKSMVNRHLEDNILPNYKADKEIFKTIENNATAWRFCFNSHSSFKELVKEDEFQRLLDLGFKAFKIQATEFVSSKYQTVVKFDTIFKKQELQSYYDSQ